jgi:hypothetical protein
VLGTSTTGCTFDLYWVSSTGSQALFTGLPALTSGGFVILYQLSMGNTVNITGWAADGSLTPSDCLKGFRDSSSPVDGLDLWYSGATLADSGYLQWHWTAGNTCDYIDFY